MEGTRMKTIYLKSLAIMLICFAFTCPNSFAFYGYTLQEILDECGVSVANNRHYMPMSIPADKFKKFDELKEHGIDWEWSIIYFPGATDDTGYYHRPYYVNVDHLSVGELNSPWIMVGITYEKMEMPIISSESMGKAKEIKTCPINSLLTSPVDRYKGDLPEFMEKSPQSLPTLGEPVELHAILGATCNAFNWGEVISFGPQQPLNYLSKIMLMENEETMVLYLPEIQGIMTLLKNTTTGNYDLSDSFRRLIPLETIATLDTSGATDKITLTYPDGRVWEYLYESTNDFQNQIFRIVKRTSKDGYDTTIAYNSGNVTITDASSNAYVCALNSKNRITSIAAGGRTWFYNLKGNEVNVDAFTKALWSFESGDTCFYAPEEAFTSDANTLGLWDFDTETTAGRFGNCVSTDGTTTSYEEISDSATYELGSSNFTLELLYMPDEASQSGNIVHKDGSYTLYTVNNALTVTLYDSVSGSVTVSTDNNTLIDNFWNHISVIRDSNVITVFVNGKYAATTSFSGTVADTANSIIIGKEIDGLYDEFRISNTGRYSLSPTEDSTTNNNHAAITNGAILREDIGISGDCILCNGESEYLTVADNSSMELGSSDFSVEAWVNPEALDSTINTVISKSDTSKSFELYISSTGNLVFKVSSDGTAETTLTSTQTISTDTWTHVAAVRAGTTITLYINGASDNSTTFSGSVYDNANPLLVAAGKNSGLTSNYFNGKLDEVLIYGADRSAAIAEIAGREVGEHELTETTPDGMEIVTRTNENGNIILNLSKHGSLEDREEFDYDSEGKLTKITINGIETNVVESTVGTYRKRVFTTGSLVNTVYTSDYGLYKTSAGSGELYSCYTYRGKDFQITTKTDERSNSWIYNYDDNIGKITYEYHPDGGTYRYYYDANGNMTREQRPLGTYYYAYDTNNNLTLKTLPNTGTFSYEYDSNNLVTKETDPNNNVTLFTYDSRGLQTSVKGPYPSGDTPPTCQKSFYYDTWGNLTQEVDELGKAWNFYYDTNNLKTREVDPLSNETLYYYDGLGRMTQKTDATSASTIWHYDIRGLVTKIEGVASAGGGCSSCGMASGVSSEPGDYYYSTEGLLTKFTNLNGKDTTYEYDSAGRKTKQTDARSYETTFEYDASGNVTKVTDPNSHEFSYSYDAYDRITLQSNTAGSSRFYYNTSGNLTRILNPDSGNIYKYYNNMGYMTQYKNPLNKSTMYLYDLAGNLTRTTYPDSTYVQFFYDPAGRMTKKTDQASKDTLYSYDDAGRLSVMTDPLLKTTTYFYDDSGRLTRVTDPLGHNTDYAYDELGRKTQITDGAGRSISTAFNSMGLVTQQSDGVTSVTYAYDNVGNKTSETVSGKAPVTYLYDDTNNLTRTEQDDGTTTIITSRTYDGAGLVLTSTDAAGKVSNYYYDSSNRLTSVTDPLSNSTAYEYDAVGRRTKVTYADGIIQNYSFNSAGQITLEDGGPKGQIAYLYDDLGRLTKTTDANGRSRDTYYDNRGLVTKIENEMDEEVIYAYDDAGRRTSLTDAESHTTSYEYDDAGRLTRMVYPDTNAESYVYDNGNLLITKVTPNADNISYSYNAAGKPSSVGFGGGAVSYSYDSSGLVTSISGPVTTTGYSYDSFGRLTSVNDSSLAKTVSYEYDLRGLRTQLTGPDSTTISYVYDDAMRLTSVQKGTDTPAIYEYDAGGKRTKLTLPNSVETTYLYDTSGRLTNLSTVSGATTLASFSYALDSTGNRTAVTMSDGYAVNYSFDNAYRLTGEIRNLNGQKVYESSFQYDAVGNRTHMASASYPVSEYDDDPDNCGIWDFENGGIDHLLPQVPLDSDSYTVLLYHFEESDTVTDSSSSNNTGSIVGSPVTLAPGRFGYALQFTASGQHVEAADAASLEFSNADFSIEAAVMPDGISGSQAIVSKWGSEKSFSLNINSGKLELQLSTDGSTTAFTMQSANSLKSGEWSWVSVVRESGKIRLYINGNLEGEGDFTGTVFDGSETLRVAAAGDGLGGTTNQFLGYLDELRISCISRYGTAPTPDTSGNLNHGELMGNSYLDNGGRFGKALQLDGDGDYVSITDSASLELSSSNFTIEGWIKPETVTGDSIIAAKWENTQGSWKLRISDGEIELDLSGDGTTTTTVSSGSTISAQNWTHIAAQRKDNTISLFINGIKAVEGAFTGSVFDSTAALLIGAESNGVGGATNEFTGMIEELRISKIARYNSVGSSDTSGKGNHGRLSGDASLVVDGSRSGNVLSLDGDGDVMVIDAAESLNLGAGNFEISAYVCPSALGGLKVIASQWDAANKSYIFGLRDGKPEIKLSADAGGTSVTTIADDTALAQSVWHKVSVIRVGSSILLKVDDVTVAAGTFTGSISHGTAAFRIGSTGVTGEEGYFAGSLDDVTVKKGLSLIPVLDTGEITYTYNSANQLVTEVSGSVTKTYTYDNNGNNLGWSDTLGNSVTMTYDQLNRMQSWTDGTNTESSTYRGAEWHRHSNTVNGVATSFLYDSDNVLADVQNGNISKFYVSPFLDQNLSVTDVATSSTYYYSQDGLGSVRILTDNAGVVQNRYDYTAFGKTYSPNTTIGVDQRYGYTGREASSIGAPMYYRYRQYNPSMGRFIGRDALGYGGSPDGNLYAYTMNRPSLFDDPYGLTLFDYIITGDWNPKPEVKRAAERSLGREAAATQVVIGASNAVVEAGSHFVDLGRAVGGAVSGNNDAAEFAEKAWGSFGKRQAQQVAAGTYTVGQGFEDSGMMILATNPITGSFMAGWNIGSGLREGDYQQVGGGLAHFGMLANAYSNVLNRPVTLGETTFPTVANALGTIRTWRGIPDVLFEATIRGRSAAWHRVLANRYFLKMLEENSRWAECMARRLGFRNRQELIVHMRSAKNPNRPLNPSETEWHHPQNDPVSVQLLRESVHNNPRLQGTLHGGELGSGGVKRYNYSR